ncbi:MAG: beta-galactosidase [Armatimonadota bacterium]
MKYRGVAYYPEYWPEERWDEDIRLMREAHINLVRVGEFAWAAMEPVEGEFTLDWLHRLVGKMAAAEINVLLCTPTAAPPAWLTSAYPETVMMPEEGKRHTHGIRRHYCPMHPTYRAHTRRITEKLSRDFSPYANIAGWHIDNELGPERGWCHCDYCQGQFQQWLRERYGTLEELNRRWGTRFWSVEYSAWEQIQLAGADRYPSAQLDTRRFKSFTYVDFAAEQVRILRANHPGALITTNGMGPIFEPINYFDLYDLVDRAAADQYFDVADMASDSLANDLFRCYKPNTPWWMTETGSGALTNDKVPAAGQLRAWAYSGLARGCEAWCFFRWRTCLSGQEQELQGVIEHSGKPRRRYAAVQHLFTELDEFAPHFAELPMPKAEVAIIHDYDVLWGYKSSSAENHIHYKELLQRVYRPFFDRHVLVDFPTPAADLSAYKLVVLPSLTMIDEDFAARLRAYVAAGGTVLSLPQLACRDRNDNYLPACAPVGLHDLFGLRVEGGMYLRSFVGPDQALWFPQAKSEDETPAVRVRLSSGDVTGTAGAWMEDIELEGGVALGTFLDNEFAGCPFFIEQTTGSGKTRYLGAYPSDSLLADIVEDTLAQAGIAGGPETPEWVEIIRRGDYTFVINHRNDAVTVPMIAESALVGTYRDGQVELGPYDVCILVGAPASLPASVLSE